MVQVSFISNGRSVTFDAKKKKKRPNKDLTPYQRHVRKVFAEERKRNNGQLSMEDAQQVMKMAAKSWKHSQHTETVDPSEKSTKPQNSKEKKAPEEKRGPVKTPINAKG